MSKTIIEVKCIDQVLTLTNTPVIASGGQGEDYVHFDLCEKWDGFAVSGVFWRKGVDCIPVLLDADNTCQVPPELMTSEGVIYFGAVGVAPDGTTRTSEPVSYLIREGVITENTALPIPGEDVYQQLMAYYADVKLYVSTRIDEAADAAVQAGGNAQAALAAAEQAERHAAAAVDAIESVIYPGTPTSVTNGSTMTVHLDNAPEDRMILAFIADKDTYSVDKFILEYENDEGKMIQEEYVISDAVGSKIYWEAFRKGDYVAVMLNTADKMAMILNPSITSTVKKKLQDLSDTMDERIGAPGGRGLAAAATGTAGNQILTLISGSTPVDGTIVRFSTDTASEDTNGIRIYCVGSGFDKVFSFVDADGNPLSGGVHSFGVGSWVAALLDVANLKAYILNPVHPGTELVKYTGDGNGSRSLEFTRKPKAIYILTMSNYSEAGDYLVLFRDFNLGKMAYIFNGEPKRLSFYIEGAVTWGSTVRIIFDANIPANKFNVSGCEYIAIGIM